MIPCRTTASAPARSVVAALVLLQLVLALSGCFDAPKPDQHGRLALESGEFLLGAWLGEWPSSTTSNIPAFQEETGVRLDLVDIYLDWATPVDNVTHAIEAVAASGAVAVLTWEAQGITTIDVLAGDKRLPLRDGRVVTLDDYLAEFAVGTCRVAQATEQPVLLRIFHEMNGAWFAWGISYQDAKGGHPNSDDSYKAAWAKVHNAFSGRCGDSVRFVWAVNHFSVGPGTSFMGTYPGDDKVDFVAIDGYNWGANARWGWQSFDVIFSEAYCALAGGTTKPILIAEVASTEKGGDKAQWIDGLYQGIAGRDRIRGFVWFDDAKFEVEIHGAMDWPVDSSTAALQSYSQGARTFQEGLGSTPSVSPEEDGPC